MATEVVHRVRFVSFRFVFFSSFSTIFPMMDFQNFNGCCLALPRTAEQALKSSHSPSSFSSPPLPVPTCRLVVPSSHFAVRSLSRRRRLALSGGATLALWVGGAFFSYSLYFFFCFSISFVWQPLRVTQRCALWVENLRDGIDICFP